VLLNGHGGNRSSLEVLGEELFVELGLTVNTLAYWDLVPDLVKSLKKTQSSGMGHSGELETSLMLYLAPGLVNRQDIPHGILGVDDPGPTSGIKRYVNMKEHRRRASSACHPPPVRRSAKRSTMARSRRRFAISRVISASFLEKLSALLPELLVVALAPLNLFHELDLVGVFQRRMNAAQIDKLAILGECLHALPAVPMVDP